MLFTVQNTFKKTVAVIFATRICRVNIQQRTTGKDKKARKGQSHCKYELYSIPQISIKYYFAFNSACINPGICLSAYYKKLSYATEVVSPLV